MRNFNNTSGLIQFELSGVTAQGAFHMLDYYYSVSEIGAIIQAKKDYGNKYVSYQASKR